MTTKSAVFQCLISAAMFALTGCTTVDSRTDSTRASAGDTAPPTVNAGGPMTVSSAGIGGVRVGQSLSQAAAALHEPLSVTPPSECAFVRPRSLPAGVRLMIARDTVVRIDVDSTGVPTAEQVGVGELETRLVQVYGARAVVGPHKYTGPVGHYVTVTTAGDPTTRLVFETDGNRVLRYRIGRPAAVELVEGCG